MNKIYDEYKKNLKNSETRTGKKFTNTVINAQIKILSEELPKKLNEYYKTDIYKNLFLEIDLNKIREIQKKFLKGSNETELLNWNREKRARGSSSLYQYIKFLESKKGHLKGDDNMQNEDKINLKIKNIMLYGAPGVGKTHNYKKLVSLIESGKYNESDIFKSIIENQKLDINIDKTFEIIKNEKRIEFVTFHQSYSYEDFIEGFRPSEEDEKIVRQDGIFKILCDDAKINLFKSVDNKEILFNDALNLILKEKIENQENVKIDLKRNNSFYNIYDYNDKTIYFEKQNGDKSHTLSLKTLEKMYYEGTNNIINGGLAPYYNPLLEELLKLKNKSKVEKSELKNFYIVIDEINRGNISKIFGELITLIEEDKRDDYEVTLPYSKEKFKIPSNLYIIATMNSTDKSIATIDIALRRRFTFLKMEPKEELVKNENAKALMKELNEYIKKTIGKDYQLGHSYFMKIENEDDLSFVKEYKIKPLLEEYFYGDNENYKKDLKILGFEDELKKQ